MDIWDKDKRSEIMKSVHCKNTKPEILVRKFLFANGFRYRNNVKTLPGSPDIVLPKYKTIIFINGCFWHGHNCRAGRLPNSNIDYWHPKILSNIERDKNKIEQLKNSGWHVIVIWQCELKNKEKCSNRLNSLIAEIKFRHIILQ